MGQMKEIYVMIQDGSSEMFKDAYKHARINNELGFTFNYKFYDIIKAKSIMRLIEKGEKEYNEMIDAQAEMHAEWQAEIRRGK
tara:strand:- start:149 stop:397 length:249 start_codon:yes stop_codon:yes gene_type:complete